MVQKGEVEVTVDPCLVGVSAIGDHGHIPAGTLQRALHEQGHSGRIVGDEYVWARHEV